MNKPMTTWTKYLIDHIHSKDADLPMKYANEMEFKYMFPIYEDSSSERVEGEYSPMNTIKIEMLKITFKELKDNVIF